MILYKVYQLFLSFFITKDIWGLLSIFVELSYFKRKIIYSKNPTLIIKIRNKNI